MAKLAKQKMLPYCSLPSIVFSSNFVIHAFFLLLPARRKIMNGRPASLQQRGGYPWHGSNASIHCLDSPAAFAQQCGIDRQRRNCALRGRDYGKMSMKGRITGNVQSRHIGRLVAVANNLTVMGIDVHAEPGPSAGNGLD